jgi:hypothetical protein
VRIEPAGWGTKVILTAEPTAVEEPPVEEPAEPLAAEAEPAASEPPAEPPPRGRRFTRLWAWLRGPEPEREPPAIETPPPEPEREPDPEAVEAVEAPPEPQTETEAALTAALDSLGQAHHRPYSRA